MPLVLLRMSDLGRVPTTWDEPPPSTQDTIVRAVAETADRQLVNNPHRSDAARWCSLGALARVWEEHMAPYWHLRIPHLDDAANFAGLRAAHDAFTYARRALNEQAPAHWDVSTWNDVGHRRHSEVLALFDRGRAS